MAAPESSTRLEPAGPSSTGVVLLVRASSGSATPPPRGTTSHWVWGSCRVRWGGCALRRAWGICHSRVSSSWVSRRGANDMSYLHPLQGSAGLALGQAREQLGQRVVLNRVEVLA